MGGVYLAERRTITNSTTCSECVTLTLNVPAGCRLNADILEAGVKELFKTEAYKELCRGCPLQTPRV
jgi:hypothetical protein